MLVRPESNSGLGSIFAALESGLRWRMLLSRTKAGTRVRWSAVNGQRSVRSWWKKSKSSERFIYLFIKLPRNANSESKQRTRNHDKSPQRDERLFIEFNDWHGVILTLLRNKRVKNISVKLCKKNNYRSDLDSPFPFLSRTMSRSWSNVMTRKILQKRTKRQ